MKTYFSITIVDFILTLSMIGLELCEIYGFEKRAETYLFTSEVQYGKLKFSKGQKIRIVYRDQSK